MNLTTALKPDVSQFDVIIEPAYRSKNAKDLSVYVVINNVRHLVAYTGQARINGKVVGFTMGTISVATNHIDDAVIRSHFRGLINKLEFLSCDVQENGSGLTRAEVEHRAWALAGILLASMAHGELRR